MVDRRTTTVSDHDFLGNGWNTIDDNKEPSGTRRVDYRSNVSNIHVNFSNASIPFGLGGPTNVTRRRPIITAGNVTIRWSTNYWVTVSRMTTDSIAKTYYAHRVSRIPNP